MIQRIFNAVWPSRSPVSEPQRASERVFDLREDSRSWGSYFSFPAFPNLFWSREATINTNEYRALRDDAGKLIGVLSPALAPRPPGPVAVAYAKRMFAVFKEYGLVVDNRFVYDISSHLLWMVLGDTGNEWLDASAGHYRLALEFEEEAGKYLTDPEDYIAYCLDYIIAYRAILPSSAELDAYTRVRHEQIGRDLAR